MNWVLLKVPVSHMCLAGTVVACCSPNQECLVGRGSSTFTVMTNILSLNSANSVKTFRKTSKINLKLVLISWTNLVS